MQATIRENDVYCRIEFEIIAGCKYNRTRFIMRTFCEKMTNSFRLTTGLAETIGMFTNLMEINI